MAEIRKPFPAPEAVTGYFDRKVLKPSFSWLDIYGEEHANAMTVAGAVELEVLEAFRSTMSESLGNGEGFETWKEKIATRLTGLGWFGPRLVKDPRGLDPDKLVNYASDRRLKLIFWSNMNSARAAGQWERAQKSKRFLPYLLYVRTTSSEPRPEHLAFAGTILPVDDPFWNTHFPPNGWLCKCTVRQITRREADRLKTSAAYSGTRPETGPDRPHVNRRTGQVEMIPEGIDAGWHTNPGRARTQTLIQSVSDRLEAASNQDATRVLTDLWSDPFLRIAPKLPDTVFLPAGRSESLAVELAEGTKRTGISPVVAISSREIAEPANKKRIGFEDVALLPRIISGGTILQDPKNDAGRRSVIARLGKIWWQLYVILSPDGQLRISAPQRRSRKQVEELVATVGRSIDDIQDLLDEY
jgi:SPP1 gp7 family putative phage head morphogenesis protein